MKKFIYLSLFLISLFALGACSKVYEVTYLDFDGSVIATYKVNPGEVAPIPDSPIREGFIFEAWDPHPIQVMSDLNVTATYSVIEPEKVVEPLIVVLTQVEGIERTLEDFLNQDFVLISSIDDIDWTITERLLVLYDESLRKAIHPVRLEGKVIQSGYMRTYTHSNDVDITMVYLEDLEEFESFFSNVSEAIFDIQETRIVYELYRLKGVTVYQANSSLDPQLLINVLPEDTELVRPNNLLKKLYVSEEIYVFLTDQIPAFLSEYEDQINALNHQAIEIFNERGQRFVIGKAEGLFVAEYYSSFINSVKDGFEGLIGLSLSPPEHIDFPQQRPVSADFCYLRDLRGKATLQNPPSTTVSHEIPLFRFSSKGSAVGLVVLIGFNEFEPELSDDEYFSEIERALNSADKFYQEMSNGQLNFEWIYHPDIVYVPFFLDETIHAGLPGFMDLINSHISLVLAEVEKITDLTNVDFINFFWPLGLPPETPGGLAELRYEPINTERGTIYNYILQTLTGDPVRLDHVLKHEIAHLLGLTDTYIFPWIEEYIGKPHTYYYGHWDLMAGGNEFKAWHRWILKWMPDEQVYCLPLTTNKEFKIFLEPLNQLDADIKQIVISLSETQAISIELRGPGSYCSSNCSQDVLVTHIDSNIYLGPLKIIRPNRSVSEDHSDSLLLEGEYVKFQNITIIHSERYGSGSVITIQFD